MDTHRTIHTLVDENFVYASVLYHFGIPFFQLPHLTLEAACRQKGLNVSTVVQKLENSVTHTNDTKETDLVGFPIDLIVVYLQHAHHIFIKQRLPYLGELIGHLSPEETGASAQLVQDLQFVFPLFAEDFIHHIYEEEDTLFGYLRNLQAFQEGEVSASEMYFQMEKNSIQRFAIEHLVEDDEMLGLRRITHDYQILPQHSTLLKVLYQELQAFEQELKIHARIENEVLFPKALMLEHHARKAWAHTVGSN